MPNFNQEIANAPIAQTLGAFAETLVDSQYAASLKAFDIFKSVAFDSNGDLEYVPIRYNRINPDYDPNSTSPETPTISQEMQVPLVLFFPQGNMSITSADYELDIQLNSTEYQKSTTQNEAEASLKFKAKMGWWGSLEMKGRVAHKRTNSSGSEIKRRYGLNVKVHMEREDPPEVVDKIFGLMLDGLNQAAPSE